MVIVLDERAACRCTGCLKLHFSMIKKYYSKYSQSTFFRNFFVLSSASALSQLITIVSAPVLTRVFLPQDYDELGIYLMMTNLLGTVSTLQIHNVIIVSNKDDEALHAFKICVVSSLMLSLLFLFGFILLTQLPFGFSAGWLLSKWNYLAPMTLLLSGWNIALSSWANRKQNYRELSQSRILGALLTPLIAIPLGKLIAGPTGLFAGLIVGQIVPVVYLGRAFLRSEKLRFSGLMEDSRPVLRRHRNFVRYSLITDLVNNLINQSPIIFLLRTSEQSGVIGNYNLCNRILGLPVQVLSGSFGEVFRQKASSNYHESGKSIEVFMLTLRVLSIMAIIPFLAVMVFGPQLFALIFGDKWHLAGVFSAVLAPMFFFKFISSPLSYMYFIAGRQREDLLGHIIMLVFTVLIFLFSAFMGLGIEKIFLLYGLVFSSIYIIYLIRSYHFSLGSLATR